MTVNALCPVEIDLGVGAIGGSSYRSAAQGLVRVGSSLYLFFINASADLAYKKSTNNGATWASAVTIHSATYERMAVWFDQWTPGGTGTVVHIWGIDTVSDDVNYFSLDTSTDTLGNGGTAIQVFAGVASSAGNTELAGCKTRGGNLLVAYDLGGAQGCNRSTDSGATWTARASPFDGFNDFAYFMPGNYADNQDADIFYWDTSDSEISIKFYDDSADSFAETSISGSMAAVGQTTALPQWFVTVRPTDGHALLAAWSERDTATADLKTWDINGPSSITAKTNIHTDIDDCQCVALTIAASGDVIATYIGKGDGSETVSTALGIYQKGSSDGMGTWGTEETVMNTPLMQAQLLVGCPYASSGPYVAWLWENYNTAGGADGYFCAVPMRGARAQSLVGV